SWVVNHGRQIMKLGYLLLATAGQSYESGVTRYGRCLATAARSHHSVLEQTVVLTHDSRHNSDLLRRAAMALAQSDLIHFQYSPFLWGEGRPHLHHLQGWLGEMARRSLPWVVTLHDVHQQLYPPQSVWQVLQAERRKYKHLSGLQRLALRTTWRYMWHRYGADRQAMRLLLQQAGAILTCHRQEKQRLAHFEGAQRIKVIPHFVASVSSLPLPEGPSPGGPSPGELSPGSCSTAVAKSKLGLSAQTVIILQGFIYPRKGHALAIEALGQLPETVHLVFAGAVVDGQAQLLKGLWALAKQYQVEHRLTVTGYLCDADLDLYLRASDLAICPFETLSASGSLSRWIAHETPILATNLPQIETYNQRVPGAIATFSPYTAAALAEAILTQLAQPPLPQARQQLRSQLSLPQIFERHVECYAEVLEDVP
ncbi:MAG: glycosyltransferase, partial [Cyanobacteria bacterium P01_F01_bin.4]